MANTASDVDEEYALFADRGSDLTKGQDVQPFAIARNTHQVLKPLELLRILLCPWKEVEFSAHPLVPGEFAASVIPIICTLQEIRERLVGRTADVEASIVRIEAHQIWGGDRTHI
jgi:hypothetical protein